jgi:N-acetylneuraminate lyase
MTFEKLTGLVAATHTPLNDDGSLNPEAVGQQAAHLTRNGVTGAFIAGTTGESHSLTVAERKALADRWATTDSPLKLIVHVGHNCLPDAQDLAAHAQMIGADGIAALAPSYFRPANVEALVDWCAAIAERAPDLPFYFYDIPALTGVVLPMVDFLRLAGDRIPNLAGIKYTNSDLATLQRCLAVDDGRFDILFGCDEALLAGMALGCKGAVGSSYNFAAPIYQQVITAFENGDLESAKHWQTRSAEMIAIIARFGYGAAAKSVMQLIGVDCGPVRQPLARMAAGEIQKLRQDLNQLGFFDWIGIGTT